MAETSKNKIYYNNDENSIADILADMKKLAESADNAIETKVDKDSGKKLSTNDFTNEYKNKLDELNNYDDTKIKEELEEVKEENTRLKEDLNALPTVQGNGEYVTLDTAECRFKNFSVEGKSEQETTEGYNLCNIPNQTINGVTIINSNNGLILNGTCSSTFSIVALKQKVEAGDYIIKKLGDGASNATYQSVIYKNNNIVAYVAKANKSITFENDDEIRLQLYIYSGTVFNNLILPVQVCKDNDRPYEPYTGGIPSPNNEYPSEIRNVGDNINVFDLSKYQEIGCVLNGTAIVTDTEMTIKASTSNVTYTNIALANTGSIIAETYRKYCMKIPEGANKLIINFKNNNTARLASVYYNVLDENYTVLNGIIRIYNSTDEEGILQADINVNNAKYVLVRFDATINGDVTYKNISLGNLDKYTPYGQGSINIKIQNENLFDEKFFADNGFLKNKDYYYGNATNSLRYKNFPNSFEKNTQYIISFNAYDTTITTGRGLFFEVKYTDSSKYDININSSSAKDYMYISDSNKTIDCITCLTGGFGTETYIKNFSIIKGTTAKSYIEHKEQNITFSLDKPLCQNCYLAEDGIHYTRKQIVLDGSEDEKWSLSATNTSNQNRFVSKIIENEVKRPSNADEIANIICSHFIKESANETYRRSDGIAIHPNGIICLYHDAFKEYTISEFKTRLSNNPITLEYELATEEIVPYTEEQKQQREQLKNARSYEGQTHILSTDEINPNFNITARANLSEILNKLQGE